MTTNIITSTTPSLQPASSSSSSSHPSQTIPLSLMQGPKFRTLTALKEKIEKAQRTGDPRVFQVNVPSVFSLNSKQVFEFLTKEDPNFFDWWLQLRSIYESGPKEFLDNPTVPFLIEKGQEAIKAAFSQGNYPWQESFEAWGKSLPLGSFVAIRSDSDGEDGVVANAGGNLTLSYIDPDRALPLFGHVIASYFDIRSLSNQIRRDANPFTVCPLSVGVQHLIDESSSIPVSGVFFSNEPLYVDGQPFTVMQISSTYGHGEAVVGSAGIQTDTFYVLRSKIDPAKIYVVDDLQQKRERLAPKKGKLTEVLNPIELRNVSSLTPKMIQRLYDFSQFLNEHYEKPSDVEFVFKEGILHIVQRRDINRSISKAPSYLEPTCDFRKTYPMKVIVSGHLQAQVVDNFSDILIRDTLDEAQFVKEDSPLVIVKQDEPKLSHPTINFKERQTPAFFTPDELEPPERGNITAFSPQQGLVVQSPADSIQITPGYIDNPAPLGFGRPDGTPIRPAPAEVQKRLQSLMMELTAERTRDTSASSSSQPSFSLKPIKQTAGWPKFKQQAEQAKEFSSHAKEIRELVRTTAKELKRSLAEGPRLENLFFAKALRILLLDGVASLSQVLEQTLAFEEKSSERLSSLSIIETLTPEMRSEWVAFLHAIDKEAPVEEIDTFKRLLHTLGNLQSLWITFYFIPHAHLPPLDLLRHLMEGIDEESLEFVERLDNEEISFLEDFTLFKTHYLRAPNLIQLIALSSLARFVDAYDKKLKQILTSPLKFEEKFSSFKEKLLPFHSLMYAIVTELLGPDGFTHTQQTQEQYLEVFTEHCEGLLSQPPSSTLLDPSEGFNVAASRLGAGTVFGARIPIRTRTGQRAFRRVNGREVRRYVPQSFADWHTLDHQNCNAALSCLLKKLLFSAERENPLPQEIKESMQTLSSRFEERINLTGIEQDSDALTIKYNIPLRNHSGTCTLHYQQGRLLFSAEMLGEARERWRRSAGYLHFLKAQDVLPFRRITLRGNVLRFSCPIANQAEMEKACEILKDIHTYSLSRTRNNPELTLIQKLTATRFETFNASCLTHIANTDILTGIHYFLTQLIHHDDAINQHGAKLLSLTLCLANQMEPNIPQPILDAIAKLYSELLRSNPERGIQSYKIPYSVLARLGDHILTQLAEQNKSTLFYGWLPLEDGIRFSEGIRLIEIALSDPSAKEQALGSLKKLLEKDSGALIVKNAFSLMPIFRKIVEEKIDFSDVTSFLAKITDGLIRENHQFKRLTTSPLKEVLPLLYQMAIAGNSTNETFEILEKLTLFFPKDIPTYLPEAKCYSDMETICLSHLNHHPESWQNVMQFTLALATNPTTASPMEHSLSRIMENCLNRSDFSNKVLCLRAMAQHINQLEWPRYKPITDSFLDTLIALHSQGATQEVLSIIQELDLSPHTPFIVHDSYQRGSIKLVSLLHALYQDPTSHEATIAQILKYTNSAIQNPNKHNENFESRLLIELISKIEDIKENPNNLLIPFIEMLQTQSNRSNTLSGFTTGLVSRLTIREDAIEYAQAFFAYYYDKILREDKSIFRTQSIWEAVLKPEVELENFNSEWLQINLIDLCKSLVIKGSCVKEIKGLIAHCEQQASCGKEAFKQFNDRVKKRLTYMQGQRREDPPTPPLAELLAQREEGSNGSS